MGKTIAEKILARASGSDDLSPGDHVMCDVDVAMSHDGTVAVAEKFRSEGVEEIWDTSKLVTIIDHIAPAHGIDDANDKSYMREFIDEHDIETFYEVGTGISHEVLPEKGHIRPGELVVGIDSHTVTHGAYGAAGTGIGTTDMAYIFATGQTWFRVPETVRFHVEGEFPEPTSAKDLVLYIAGTYGTGVARYCSIEYTGPAVESMPLDERMVLSNMAIELGGKFGFTPVDDVVTDYVDERTDKPYTPVYADDDAEYEETYTIDVSDLRPQIAAPHKVGNVSPIDDIGDVELDQVFIGSCTDGKYEDLKRAAEVLEGNEVARGTRLIITPASREIHTRAVNNGLVEIFNDAGAVVTNSTCGACPGRGLGVIGDGEVCLSAMNRNFRGRMGSDDAEIYLSSPQTAAASAIEGRIVEPKEGVVA
ncbi:3-isopropylmalate dehydratase large subunit [Halobellus salinisoli]|uniref:3-isopropylmalate dehydratase large subunit n=1 Tax=Halobellus salinisoli TaxID=3108500 RepID=UPI00300980A5